MTTTNKRNKSKLGILIQHYDARNDIRHLIDQLVDSDEIVIFADQKVLVNIETKAEKRIINQNIPPLGRLWILIYSIIGNLPKSKNNFIINCLFKQEGSTGLQRIKQNTILTFRSALAGVISFDFLTRRLKSYDKTDISDIRKLLAITDFSNIAFISKVLNSDTPVDAYVYSWDHACKHPTFSKKIRKYLTWGESINDDLVELQGIDRARCKTIGATQFLYFKEFKQLDKSKLKTPDFNYFYYGCGIGNMEMSKREALLIEAIAKECLNKCPDYKLIVRPYPMLRKTEHFKHLTKYSNIVFDDDYQSNTKDRSLSQLDIFQRIYLQSKAAAFLHCGTTMGLECCYLDTPSIFVSLDSVNSTTSKPSRHSLPNFINQYHNVKYLQQDNFPNVVRNEEQLCNILHRATQNDSTLLDYNKHIAGLFPIIETDQIVRSLIR